MKKLKPPKIYIVPSRFGLLYFSGTIAMMIIAGTYSNNLVFLLSFILFSIGISAMFFTNSNLKQLILEDYEIQNQFAKEDFIVSMNFFSLKTSDSFNIQVSLEIETKWNKIEKLTQTVLFVKNSISSNHLLKFKLDRRGKYKVRRVKLSSTYPLGLFTAWTWIKDERDFYVYPNCFGSYPFETKISQSDSYQKTKRGGDDFWETKDYVYGDSIKRIDWKNYAKSETLKVKVFDANASEAYVVSFDPKNSSDIEMEISAIAQLIRTAFSDRVPLELRMPIAQIQNASSSDGFHQALKILSDWPSSQRGTST
jgi:uncharacterized protein (DUF58 family)